MARMIEGQWEGEWRPTDEDGDGAFLRKASAFRDRIPPRLPEPGRYHLFVAWTCPWAHRTLITRALKGLGDRIPVHFANALSDYSWRFETPDASPHGDDYLYQLYLRAEPRYTGRITVPVLWDVGEGRIVNNESSEILAMLDALPSGAPSLRPPEHLAEIEALGEEMYSSLNNGVYRAGFATTQAAYEQAAREVFETLDRLEARLEGRQWLVGDRLTEADIRLFVTTFRFDAAYVPIFRCNLKRLADYPNLSAHLRRVYRTPGVAGTCNLEAMRRGYASILAINPTGIVPIGPPTVL
jgi:putative glutathione S-transferase